VRTLRSIMNRTEPKANLISLENTITSGGDERIELIHDGLNKYHINPCDNQGVFNRGTCTCSVLTDEAKERVSYLFNGFKDETISFEEVRKEQVKSLKRLLKNVDFNYNVFFAPSGSDLCYYPILFSKLINPNKPIMSLVTCPEELGSGSAMANQGQFFSEKNQILPNVVKGDSVNPDISVEYKSFNARDEAGVILDHHESIKSTIRKYKDDYSIIGNLVIGSKSGIEDNISIIEECQEDVLWVVDLCQLRTSRDLLQKLLKLNCLVMVTGSKFYQSPPFCGALLVPEKINTALAHSKPETWGFDKVYTKYDFPTELGELREKFIDYKNYGLLLRWECAVTEMKLLSNYKESVVNVTISRWNQHMTELLLDSPYFDLMLDQEKTNSSIISFRVKVNGAYLSHEQLQTLHKAIVNEPPPLLPKFRKLIIGQPVAYGDNSFIRFAIGSHNVRKLLDNDMDLTNDTRLVETIERLIKERRY